MIEFGSSELSNYNDRLEDEIKQRKMLNLHLNLFKKTLDQEQKSEFLSKKIEKFFNKFSRFENDSKRVERKTAATEEYKIEAW